MDAPMIVKRGWKGDAKVVPDDQIPSDRRDNVEYENSPVRSAKYLNNWP